MTTPFLDPNNDVEVDLRQGAVTITHLFEPVHIHAINVAVAAKRPLLIRGEPGVGKSQLARAAARKSERVFLSTVMTARTEPEELLFSFDAVARLAQAQVLGCLKEVKRDEISSLLREERFVKPGVLWWAFDWGGAVKHLTKQHVENKASVTSAVASEEIECPYQIDQGDPEKGTVVLLDEIDKADSAVPNGLLEALGHRRFRVPWHGAVSMTRSPLVVVTTNEERSLPDAFLRRCMVLHMSFPTKEKLILRGAKHANGKCDETILTYVADRLFEVREALTRRTGQRPPGQAEYLDAVRALSVLAPNGSSEQKRLLSEFEEVVFQKHGPE